MPSGSFRSIPIPSIIINRTERQRRELTGIDELAESIYRIGLINPIVITDENVLVAGERRLTACTQLGWTTISAQLVSELSEYELQVIELEENVKRVDLSWQDQTNAIARFHKLKAGHETDWTQAATAQALGISDVTVSHQLMVAEAMEKSPKIAEAERFSVARNLALREKERKATSDIAMVQAAFVQPLTHGGDVLTQVEVGEIKRPPLLCADFHEWSANYAGTKFNLIHCDFPYGINVADSPRQNSGIQEHYEDSPDVYWHLVNALADAMDTVVAESAHLIFWFSMDFYTETIFHLRKMGWKVSPFPLIWHKSDNAGIAPDPQRQPRRTYETALFATRGDRKLTQVGARSNSFAWPGKKGPDGIHLSEKPVPMLRHFMSMVCDDYSNVLDPTCGSGNALKAAESLGASSVLGIEKSNAFYLTSVARYWEKENADAL